MNRSMAKQIEHWAELGRRLESSGAFSFAQLRGFLAGEASFDALSVLEQAVAAEALLEDLERFEPSAEFERELNEGLGHSGLDHGGKIVRH